MAADTAESILLDYCRSIPNPTSSRLTDQAKRWVLKKDIRRAVEGVYQGNGRQHAVEASTKIMQKAVNAWRSKGLVFSDKATWNLTYGYAAVPEVQFTEQERKNIKAYLLPVLSNRDTKGKEPLTFAVKLADGIVRLVSAKEKQGTGISTPYLQQYIKGETGISCENKIKFGKIKEALISLGFIKVLRQGRHRCGATYYGLAGRLAETEQPSEKCMPVNEDQLESIIKPIEEQLEEDNQMDLLSIAVHFDESDRNSQQREQCQQNVSEDQYRMDLLSIPVQFPESPPETSSGLANNPVFKRMVVRQHERQKQRTPPMSTGDPLLDELVAMGEADYGWQS